MRFFFDMDGVLCDFDTTACALWNCEPDNTGWYPIEDHQWKQIEDKPEFWATMPWQPGGRELWEMAKPLDPWLLTAYNPAVMPSTIAGKITWIKNELDIPVWKAKLVMREDKHHFATEIDGTPNILIDDSHKNAREWVQRGGIVIYHRPHAAHESIPFLQAILDGDVDLSKPAHYGPALPDPGAHPWHKVVTANV